MSLTQDQINVIKATEPVVQQNGKALTYLFYKNILGGEPALNQVFSQSNQKTGTQARALAGALLAYAQHIEDISVLLPTVERICQKHASLYVRPEQYNTVGKYLLEAMAELLGDAFTPEIKDAWAAAYFQLANLMIGREKQLYSEDWSWNDWRDFRVSDKVQEAEGYFSVHLQPVDGARLPDFYPGQFISVRIDVPSLGYKQARQYSLSAKSNNNSYRVSVKREDGQEAEGGCVGLEPGVVSNLLQDKVNVGDIVGCSMPRGVFYADLDEKAENNMALISCGSGITPMMAILEALAAHKSPKKVYWVHITRNSKTHAFREHTEELGKQIKDIQITNFYTRPLPGDRSGVEYDIKGRPTPEQLIKGGIGSVDDFTKDFCICGPNVFMEAMKDALLQHGVAAEQIKTELFNTGGLPEPLG